jgi:hypothetical protein
MNYVKRIFSEISQLTGQDENIPEPQFTGKEIDYFLKKTALILAAATGFSAIIILLF